LARREDSTLFTKVIYVQSNSCDMGIIHRDFYVHPRTLEGAINDGYHCLNQERNDGHENVYTYCNGQPLKRAIAVPVRVNTVGHTKTATNLRVSQTAFPSSA
jgi:hypothetical protein